MDLAGMDLTAIRAEMTSLEDQLTQMRDGYEQLQRTMQELRVSVTSADGHVTATVDARGQVLQIEIDPKIYQRPDSRLLAATITATIHQATAEIMEQVQEQARSYLPEGAFNPEADLESLFRGATG